MKTFFFTLIMFCFSSLSEAQSIDLLDKEEGYSHFKFGETIKDLGTNTIYQPDFARSTKTLRAYQYKEECCTHFKGVEIDGIVLYLNTEEELSKIEFLIAEARSLQGLAQCLTVLQDNYGLFSDYILATGDEKTSSFFWKTDRRHLTMRMTAMDISKKEYQVELLLSKI